MDSNKEWIANRDSDGIVYCFADGTTQTICLDDYLRINPEYTAEDFYKIKELSDTLFLSKNRQTIFTGAKNRIRILKPQLPCCSSGTGAKHNCPISRAAQNGDPCS